MHRRNDGTPNTWLPPRRARVLSCAVVLLLIALAARSLTVRAGVEPSVRTDRTAYPAGDVVEITATGFAPNDVVTVQVTHADGTMVEGMGHDAWVGTADAAGALLGTWWIDPRDTSVSGFQVTIQSAAGIVRSPVFQRRAVVNTEHPGYPAGERIPMQGRGFVPGETVTLEARDAGEQRAGADPDALGTWMTTARADGTVATEWTIDPTGNENFVVQAIGSVSGVAEPTRIARTAAVRSDKSDYHPGETAVITGYGFGPNEEVTLQVVHANGGANGSGHDPFFTTADTAGRILATWFVDPDDSQGSKFLVSASGRNTGRRASTVFWDDGTIPLVALEASYTQDFDSLAGTGTSAVEPLGWDFVESGTNVNTTYTAGTGSSTTGDTYSFGQAGSADRAFGGLRSGSLVPTVGVQFMNNTGGMITSLAIAYVGEQWRLGQNTAGRAPDRLDFQLSTDATSLSTGTWTDHDALDVSSPILTGTVGALNGNVAPNRAAVAATISGLSVPNGVSFWLRWTDSDLIPGSDDGLAIDDFSLTPFGTTAPEAAPSVISSYPVNGATDVPSNASLSVTFDEGVEVAGSWFTIGCATSGAHSASVTGGPAFFTLDPETDFSPGELCTLTVHATGVTDLDTNDPPDAMAADFVVSFTPFDVCTEPFTPIYAIQGSGATVATVGSVTTQGVVVGDYEGPAPALRGFFIQDPAGDGDPLTSDGIFVFEGSNANTVNIGDLVRVTGTAGENQGQSQVSVGTVVRCGVGTVMPTGVMFPVSSADFLERYEGMLVRLPQTMYVTEHFQLGRFGQVVLSAGGRLRQPTSVAAPGAVALAIQAQNDLNQIILDDGSQAQNPDPIPFARGGQPLSAANTLRGGDTASGIVGVLNYTWAGNAASGNAYRIRPTNAFGGTVNFEPTNPRPASAPDVGGRLRVASMNLLNFFNTFSACTGGVAGAPIDCRGADSAEEFARQHPKTVAAILSVDADVLAVNELENDGYGPGSALQFLVDQLNLATAPGTYAFVDADAATGQSNSMGTDAIRSALLYRPSTVTPVGQTAVLNTQAFVNGGDGFPRNRPSIAQAFHENATGSRFVLDANHFKSKGSACDTPDTGDGQGNCNAVRTNAARTLVEWLASDPTGTNESSVLIMGDLNSHAMEDPVAAIVDAGFTNLIEAFAGPDAYSYVFDGQWGYLDHALASATLVAQVTGSGDHHINADEPNVLDYNLEFKTANLQAALYAPDRFRVSDHDPIVVGLNLDAGPSVEPGGPYSVPEGGSVTLTAIGSSAGPLVYAWDLDGDNVFETSGNPATFNAAMLDGPREVTVQVRVTTAGGRSVVAPATVTLANVAPTVMPPVLGEGTPTIGTAVSAGALFSDPAGALDQPFTCTVDYGDGSGPQPGTITGTTCVGPAHTFATYGAYLVAVTVTDKDGDSGTASAPQSVGFAWTGFFRPLNNPPVVTGAKAGSAIPVSFSLGGDYGSAIFAPGSPVSVPVSCETWTSVSEGDPVETAGGSGLEYDASSRRYRFVWKTDKSWAMSCRELRVTLVDGTTHRARVYMPR